MALWNKTWLWTQYGLVTCINIEPWLGKNCIRALSKAQYRLRDLHSLITIFAEHSWASQLFVGNSDDQDWTNSSEAQYELNLFRWNIPEDMGPLYVALLSRFARKCFVLLRAAQSAVCVTWTCSLFMEASCGERKLGSVFVDAEADLSISWSYVL